MSLSDVRKALYDLTARFFAGATVLWAEQVNTQPPLPYVTLKLGAVRRGTFPVYDRVLGRCYHYSTVAEVNLYTAGKPQSVNGKATGNHVNTAASDLLEFSNFLESEGVTDILSEPRIGISLKEQVRDLSFLENDRKHRYRAMAEYDVTFVEQAGGRFAMEGMPDVPNYSGGGTAELKQEETGFFTEAETEYVIEEGEREP